MTIERRYETLFTDNVAIFSDCEIYRYVLRRHYGPGPTINWLLLNPSTADEVDNDATLERCETRSLAMGFGQMVITNLFALRETKRLLMLKHPSPVGAENDLHILNEASDADMVVCGWGNEGTHNDRDKEVLHMLRSLDLHCLKLTKDGNPFHPLYVGYKHKPFRWERASHEQ